MKPVKAIRLILSLTLLITAISPVTIYAGAKEVRYDIIQSTIDDLDRSNVNNTCPKIFSI
jgi:hypothetical protein